MLTCVSLPVVLGLESNASPVFSSVEKAQRRRPALIENALKYETRVGNAFLDTIQAVRAQIQLQELSRLITQGQLSGVMQYLDIETRLEKAASGAGLKAERFSLLEALRG